MKHTKHKATLFLFPDHSKNLINVCLQVIVHTHPCVCGVRVQTEDMKRGLVTSVHRCMRAFLVLDDEHAECVVWAYNDQGLSDFAS